VKDLRFRTPVRRVRSMLLMGGLALLLAIVVSACSDDPTPTPTATAVPGAIATPTSSAPAVTTGGIGTFAVRRDPPANFDMMATTIWYDLNQMGAPIWGSGNLVRPCLDDVYAVCPAIAESWDSNSDFTQWTFNLRSGVNWHDGTALTVEDMKFWLDLLFTGYDGPGDATRAPAWYSTTMGDFNSTTIVDSDTIRITLNEPNPLFLDVLFTPYFTIGHARHIAEPMLAAGNMEVAPLDTEMMGLGPFTFQGYEKGSVMRVRANKDYWETDEYGRQLPYMDGMDFAIMTSADVMDAAIRTGQLDGGSPGFGYILTKPRFEAMEADLGDGFFTVKVRNRWWVRPCLERPQGRPLARRSGPEGGLPLDRQAAVDRRRLGRVRPARGIAEPREPIFESRHHDVARIQPGHEGSGSSGSKGADGRGRICGRVRGELQLPLDRVMARSLRIPGGTIGRPEHRSQT
jgi:ABC-type transport system substrate-binding protein